MSWALGSRPERSHHSCHEESDLPGGESPANTQIKRQGRARLRELTVWKENLQTKCLKPRRTRGDDLGGWWQKVGFNNSVKEAITMHDSPQFREAKREGPSTAMERDIHTTNRQTSGFPSCILYEVVIVPALKALWEQSQGKKPCSVLPLLLSGPASQGGVRGSKWTTHLFHVPWDTSRKSRGICTPRSVCWWHMVCITPFISNPHTTILRCIQHLRGPQGERDPRDSEED